SPAAYLVDVLHFLKDRRSKIVDQDEEKGVKGVKDVLFLRRPDIGEIELTCENTNTPLPYVDLVNEVLENTVAPLADFKPFNLPAAAEGALNRRSLSEVLVEVDLDAPSAGFAIPAALRDIIAYDVTRKKLGAVGFVGQPERDLLQAAAKVRS